jgi:hypothetical protein
MNKTGGKELLKKLVTNFSRNESYYHSPGYNEAQCRREFIDPFFESLGEISKIKFLGPACGSGSFLLGAFQYLIDYHKEYYRNHPREDIGDWWVESIPVQICQRDQFRVEKCRHNKFDDSTPIQSGMSQQQNNQFNDSSTISNGMSRQNNQFNDSTIISNGMSLRGIIHLTAFKKQKLR